MSEPKITPVTPFGREIRVFRSRLPDLLGSGDANEGKWAVVKGDVIDGPFPDYEDALRFGYTTYGLTGFMVKQIERVETVLYFSRPL